MPELLWDAVRSGEQEFELLTRLAEYLEAWQPAVHAAVGDEGMAGVLRQLHHLCSVLPEVHNQGDAFLHSAVLQQSINAQKLHEACESSCAHAQQLL